MKQEESKHTLTPLENRGNIIYYQDEKEIDFTIAECFDSKTAEFIVTAVNSFEADRELIKELSSLLNAVSPYLDNKGYVLYSKQIKDALAKNRGF